MRIRRICAFVYRVTLDVPIATSFGTMADRPMVLVRVDTDQDISGWGEVWCNWPACGAEHRGRLAAEELGPLLIGKEIADIPALRAELLSRLRIVMLQTGEAGPYHQALAGLDMALWDAKAKAAGKQLHSLLSPDSGADIRAYASGIDNRQAQDAIEASRHGGHRAFKVKVGFDLEGDMERVRGIRASLAPEELLMADANQAWTLAQALAFAEGLADTPLFWLEEPMAVDAPAAALGQLAEAAAFPLAGGENLSRSEDFEDAIKAGSLSVIQPDAAKWGGVSGCIWVARMASAAGRLYCPHFLGGGVGLAASAHLLAASGSGGLLEMDVNPNPLRDAISPGLPPVVDGGIALSSAPGIGVVPNMDILEPFATASYATL